MTKKTAIQYLRNSPVILEINTIDLLAVKSIS